MTNIPTAFIPKWQYYLVDALARPKQWWDNGEKKHRARQTIGLCVVFLCILCFIVGTQIDITDKSELRIDTYVLGDVICMEHIGGPYQNFDRWRYGAAIHCKMKDLKVNFLTGEVIAENVTGNMGVRGEVL